MWWCIGFGVCVVIGAFDTTLGIFAFILWMLAGGYGFLFETEAEQKERENARKYLEMDRRK